MDMVQLTDQLFVHHGCANVGVLWQSPDQSGQVLLIDCGDGQVGQQFKQPDDLEISHILMTHHHRDSASGVVGLTTEQTRIYVPEQERPYFEAVEQFWNDPEFRWHLYNYHPHHLLLSESISVTDGLKAGDQLQFGQTQITAIETPGHTDGSLSYLVESGNQRIVFSGDLIYGRGQIQNLYAMQKGEGTTDYHGFMGDRHRLMESLHRLEELQPDLLVPTHGAIIRQPSEAIQALSDRIEQCYDHYLAISALRHYFPDKFPDLTDLHSHHLPIRPALDVPVYLRHFGTTWMIIADNGEAFVMDCGGEHIIRQIEQYRQDGEISRVTGFWITHYHDDHVDAIPEFQQQFQVPTWTDTVVAEVIENPTAFRLPCISPSVAQIDHRTGDGDSWSWNEFRITAYHFPGQTYYHGGLLVEGHGHRLFFSGDSFTMSGIDDYCSGNRNLLGDEVGYQHCLKLISDLQPTHIFNCHVAPAFDFTAEQIQLMQQNLRQREKLFGQLFPWDHPNYGMDQHWVRCYPYEQQVAAGQSFTIRIDISNHSETVSRATGRPVLPKWWSQSVGSKTVELVPKTDGSLEFSLDLPIDLPTPKEQRLVIPVELTYNGIDLGQFREAVLVPVIET